MLTTAEGQNRNLNDLASSYETTLRARLSASIDPCRYSYIAPDPEPGHQAPPPGFLTPSVLQVHLAGALRALEVTGQLRPGLDLVALAGKHASIDFNERIARLALPSLAATLAAWQAEGSTA